MNLGPQQIVVTVGIPARSCEGSDSQLGTHPRQQNADNKRRVVLPLLMPDLNRSQRPCTMTGLPQLQSGDTRLVKDHSSPWHGHSYEDES
jgi:hypothetical protein